MCKSICGINCGECIMRSTCSGCATTNGCPFGRQCFIAGYINLGGIEGFNEFKYKLITEINELNIQGMPRVNDLNALVGSFVNLEYVLPKGKTVKYLDDASIYLGNQLECEFGSDRCYGVVAATDFILVCTYGENGANPELVMYKKR